MRQRFTKDSSPSLRFVAPNGPVLGAVNCTITDEAGDAVTNGAAALEGIEQTATSSPAAGDQDVTVTDASDADHRNIVWIGDMDDGPLEQNQVLSQAANVISLVEPLRFGHTTPLVTSAVVAFALTGNTGTVGVFQAVWDWLYPAAGGVTQYARQLFEIVEYVFRIPTTAGDVRSYAPLGVRIGADELILEDMIDAADTWIQTELEGEKIKPDLIRDPDQFTKLGALAAASLLIERLTQYDTALAEAADRVARRYEAEWIRLGETWQTWYDANADGDLTNDVKRRARFFLHERRSALPGG